MAVAIVDSTPLSSGEFEISDPVRALAVDRRHQTVAEFLDNRGLDALLLGSPENFAWFTAGGRSGPLAGGESVASLLITRDARVVLCGNADSGELFDRQLTGLGFLLKERPWHEGREQLVDDVCRGRRVASDVPVRSARDESRRIAELRWRLDDGDCATLRVLGRQLSHAIEATARNLVPGATEAETAGELSHRLLKHEVQPVRLVVSADARARLYRNWTFGDSPIRKWAVIGATASAGGLHAQASRVVCFGNPPAPLVEMYQQSAMLAATGFAFSHAGVSVAEAWEKVQRIYEKIGHSQEWTLCEQGAVTGYRPVESLVSPRNDLRLAPGIALSWTPSIGPIRWGDTLLVREAGAEYLTAPIQWPMLTVSVKGEPVQVPDLLCREQA
jgi:Xaa-Pro dipeptidase